jgi:DNA-directed RNA polymerase omega subunit
MDEISKTAVLDSDVATGEQLGNVIDSRFRLIVVAGLRTKQLLHGSKPRIEADSAKRRNTSIALEETRRGMVPFTIRNGLKGS